MLEDEHMSIGDGRGQKRALNFLELELQMSVSCHVGAGELNPSPLEEQPELLTTEPFLQPYIVVS